MRLRPGGRERTKNVCHLALGWREVSLLIHVTSISAGSICSGEAHLPVCAHLHLPTRLLQLPPPGSPVPRSIRRAHAWLSPDGSCRTNRLAGYASHLLAYVLRFLDCQHCEGSGTSAVGVMYILLHVWCVPCTEISRVGDRSRASERTPAGKAGVSRRGEVALP